MRDSVTPDIFAAPVEDKFSDYDPFARTPDVQPGPTKGAIGFIRQAKSAEAAILGANPELNREAAKAMAPKGKVKPDDNIKRLLKIAGDLGYFALKTEYFEANYSGMILKKDLGGIIDVIGFRPKNGAVEVLGIQDTTINSMAAHIRKMASANEVAVPGLGKRTYLDMTRSFLKSGVRIVIIGWYKEGVHWKYKEFEVTEKVIEEAIGRKRK